MSNINMLTIPTAIIMIAKAFNFFMGWFWLTKNFVAVSDKACVSLCMIVITYTPHELIESLGVFERLSGFQSSAREKLVVDLRELLTIFIYGFFKVCHGS